MVFKKVAEILSEIIGVDSDDITPDTKLTMDHEIEAIAIAKLVMECEKKFTVTIHDEDVHAFRCVNDLTEYIEKILSDM